MPVPASSVQSPCDASCSAPTNGRAQNASCLSFSERFCLGFQRDEVPSDAEGFTPTDSPAKFPEDPPLSVAAKKGTKMAAKWSPARGAVRSEPFPHLRSVVRNGPEPSRARRCWARATRTLDGEDRSEMIAEEGKAGRKIGETWSAILVPSPAASNTQSYP